MRPKVLVIDDSRLMQRLLATHLAEEDCSVEGAQDPKEGLERARAQPPALILLDLVMSGSDGFEVLRALKADPATIDTPVIVVSGRNDVSEKVRAFDMGAHDYVVKPFERAELRARVRAALRLKHYHDLLATIGLVDGLTGLWNRKYFDKRVADDIANARRYQRRFSVLMIDIDHFKRINDTHGHAAGDRVIQAVAEVLQTSVRAGDAACRYGGEEFAIILAESRHAEAAVVAVRVRERLAALSLRSDKGPIACTVSIGVACSADFDAQLLTRASITEAADQALYRAKDAGRDRFCFAGNG